VRQPDGVYSEVTVPGARVVTPEDINNHGQIAGYFYDDAGVAHGFLATPVPEPAPGALIAAGVLVLGWRQRCTIAKRRPEHWLTAPLVCAGAARQLRVARSV